MKARLAREHVGRHQVREQIERLILSGQLKPGKRLVQMDLASRFGVAQSVIRESLLELQMTGLVTSVDNSGMFVSDMDAHRLIEAYQIREVFEGLAARLCCDHATRSDLREMYCLADRTNEFATAGDLLHKSESDRQFHLSIIVASRNQALARLTTGYRAFGMVVRTDRPIDIVYAEHRAIVKAIEMNDPDLAERLARAHAWAAREIIQQQVTAGTFVPHWVLPSDKAR